MRLFMLYIFMFAQIAFATGTQPLPFVEPQPLHQDLFMPKQVVDDFGAVNPDELQLIISDLQGVRTEKGKAEAIAKRIEQRLGRTTFTALEGLLKFSYLTLKAKGHWSLAHKFRQEWRYQYRNTFKRYFYSQERSIGDYRPLSEWLANWYDKIEAALGKPLCDILHISDIKSFNYGIPVVFDPCYPQWTKKDFREHFATDGVYHGLASVTVYWVSYAMCSFGTYGMGFFVFCSAACNGIEYLFEYTIANPLADKIYDLACGT